MNNKALTAVVILLAVLCIFLVYQNMQQSSAIAELTNSRSKGTDSVKLKEVAFEVAPVMGRLQVYANKLWFAGSAGNWPLAQFYVHEIEEGFEEVEHSGAVENGVDLEKAVKEWGLTPLKKLEESVENKDKALFVTEYNNMTINCSGCHVTTQHNYIKIIVPTSPVFTNQQYK